MVRTLIESSVDLPHLPYPISTKHQNGRSPEVRAHISFLCNFDTPFIAFWSRMASQSVTSSGNAPPWPFLHFGSQRRI